MSRLGPVSRNSHHSICRGLLFCGLNANRLGKIPSFTPCIASERRNTKEKWRNMKEIRRNMWEIWKNMWRALGLGKILSFTSCTGSGTYKSEAPTKARCESWYGIGSGTWKNSRFCILNYRGMIQFSFHYFHFVCSCNLSQWLISGKSSYYY